MGGAGSGALPGLPARQSACAAAGRGARPGPEARFRTKTRSCRETDRYGPGTQGADRRPQPASAAFLGPPERGTGRRAAAGPCFAPGQYRTGCASAQRSARCRRHRQPGATGHACPNACPNARPNAQTRRSHQSRRFRAVRTCSKPGSERRQGPGAESAGLVGLRRADRRAPGNGALGRPEHAPCRRAGSRRAQLRGQRPRVSVSKAVSVSRLAGPAGQYAVL